MSFIGFYITIGFSIIFCFIVVTIILIFLFKDCFGIEKKPKSTALSGKYHPPFIVLTTVQPEYEKCSGMRRFTEPENHLKITDLMENDKRRFSDNETCKGRIDTRKESFEPDRFPLSLVENSNKFFNSLILSRLHFSISFHDSMKIMYVNIKNVNNIPCPFKQLVNCSVKVEIYNEISNKIFSSITETVTSTGNPIFEQTLAFEIFPNSINLWRLQFLIQIRESEKITRNIGFVKFPLEFMSDRRSICKEQEFWRMIIYKLKNPENIGLILTSLLFQKKHDKYKIEVGVIRAMNLLLGNNDNSIYVKVNFMNHEQIIKSERSLTIKTDIKNPLFPLTQFSFEISESKLSSSWFVVNVCSRNVFGISHIIGRCLFGPISYSDRDGNSHWLDAISMMDRMVYKWHSLKI